jgi:small subunit ribosomal protein S20
MPFASKTVSLVVLPARRGATWVLSSFLDGGPDKRKHRIRCAPVIQYAEFPFAHFAPTPVESGIRLTSRFLLEEYRTVMADHYSALKRARQTVTKTTQNRTNKSRLRTALRSLREAIAKGDKAEAQKAYSVTVSVVDKGVQKGVLHKNTASRYKARLNKRVKAVGAAK